VKGRVYALQDPTSKRIRYIGATIFDLSRRLKGHYTNASNPEKMNWLEELSRAGMQPNVIVLEEVETEYHTRPFYQTTLAKREKFWISVYAEKEKEGLVNIHNRPQFNLTREEISLVRRCHKTQKMTVGQLAKWFRIKPHQVYQIIWNDVCTDVHEFEWF
jgi:hypothetical protein